MHDPKNLCQVPGAFPEKIDLYVRIQRALYERLLHIGSDAAARDPARYIRVPGSLHTGCEEQVVFLPQYDFNGVGYTYTLTDLAERVGVAATVRREFVEFGARNPKKRAGWVAGWEYRLGDIERLLAHRGGGVEHSAYCSRNQCAWIYALCLKLGGVSRVNVEQLVSAMGSRCSPPLKDWEISAAINQQYKRGRRPGSTGIAYQTIADAFDIAPVERSQAMLDKLPPAARFASGSQRPQKTFTTRNQRVQERRRVMLQLIAAEYGGEPPPVRQMSARITAEGFCAERVQVASDYKALGLKTKRMQVIEQNIAGRDRQESLIVFVNG